MACLWGVQHEPVDRRVFRFEGDLEGWGIYSPDFTDKIFRSAIADLATRPIELRLRANLSLASQLASDVRSTTMQYAPCVMVLTSHSGRGRLRIEQPT